METRRNFLKKTAAIAGGVSVMGFGGASLSGCSNSNDPLFKISLAEWSLNKSIFGKSRQLGSEEWAKLLTDDPDALLQGNIKHLDFAKVAHQDFGIDAVEYVNTFFFNKATNKNYLKEMKTIADGEGVKNLLIMCDREGALGDPDEPKVTNLVPAPRWAAADRTAETASSRSGLPKATMRTSLAVMSAADARR